MNGNSFFVEESTEHYFLKARYLQQDAEVQFTFDRDSLLLEQTSMAGVKRGVTGTHIHDYSQHSTLCGITMPSHNEKSSDGEVWVVEDILEMN
jgi:hypothetical protein